MSKKTEEKQTYYGVFILRRDNNHMSILETSNYDEARDKWEELKKQWSESVKNKAPFEVLDPVVTVFDPGLISEIKVIPVSQMSKGKYDNPYHKKMVQNGFSNTFGNPDLLDQGYM